MTENTLYPLYLEPKNEYRGKPFWSWNGKLNKEELIRQIHVFKEMGFGGFFMHSRTGLVTEYLGDEWFDLINACAEEAEKLGMEAWLYDEDRWPSGTAGGLVTQEPKYRLKFIRLKIVSPEDMQWNEETVAAFSCHLDGMKAYDVKRIYENQQREPLKDKKVLQFTIEEMAKQSFYNGYTYLDTLNKEATETFLTLTHEKYKNHSGKHLGKAIKGIFTDEPHRGTLMDGFGVKNKDKQWLAPWTYTLFDTFKHKYDYDLVAKLPELFLQVDGHTMSQVKWHYVDLLQEMFIDNFAKPMQAWCEENDLILTGHILHEDNLTAQTAVSGSVMRYYEHMDYPGVDVLTESNVNYWIVKQLSSVARQVDKKWLLSELYGCTGWQMPLEAHKSVGDWQALFGINLRCHHLSWYTMEGEAKRDFPSSISYQSTWWKDYDYVETYFSRLGVVMTQGEPACDVLVINPVESVWAQVYPGWSRNLMTQSSEVIQLEKMYQDVFHWLSGAQIDFDYGDEDMIKRLYHIDQHGPDPILHIGQASYKVVVVAGMTTMRQSTLRILEQFVEAGGSVIFAGHAPQYIDVQASDACLELAEQAISVPLKKHELIQTCTEQIDRYVTVVDADTQEPLENIYCQVRTVGDKKYVLLMNMDRENTFDSVQIIFSEANHFIEAWDSASGERFEVPADRIDGAMHISTTFYPSDEHMYVITPDQNESLPILKKKTEEIIGEIEGDYTYTLSEDNVCVLDMASYQMNDNGWQSEEEILKVDRAIRTSLGMRLRGGEMIQPWYEKKFYRSSEAETHHLKLRFSFSIQDQLDTPVHLVMERPDLFNVTINGQTVDIGIDWATWIDHSFKKIPIPLEYFSQGLNMIELETDFHQGVDLEAIYLIGQFGVSLSGTEKIITNLPTRIEIGDLTKQGFPFYSGVVTYGLDYEQVAQRLVEHGDIESEQVMLSIPGFEAACLKVGSSIQRPHMMAWQPYEADITETVKQKKQVYIDVVLTRRNTFGPLHLNPVHSLAYGPDHFITEGSAFSREYMLIPSGLLEQPQIKKQMTIKSQQATRLSKK
ncbi:MAG TPA: glycosyl hydrolase [Candidatus Dormibacteraeota bacterium]|nr:glycosyl hydrolase [Candidatus Dormibacteraeota bacterium]